MFAQWMDETGREACALGELGVGRPLEGGTVIPELGGSGKLLANEHTLRRCYLSQEGSLWPYDFTSLPPASAPRRLPLLIAAGGVPRSWLSPKLCNISA